MRDPETREQFEATAWLLILLEHLSLKSADDAHFDYVASYSHDFESCDNCEEYQKDCQCDNVVGYSREYDDEASFE